MKRLIWCALIAAGAAHGAEPNMSPVPRGYLCPPDEHGTISGVPCQDERPADRSWHVLVQTYGGTVSLIKGLTKHEADFISKRLLGQPATPAEEKMVKLQEADRQARCAKQRTDPPKGRVYIDWCNVTGNINYTVPDYRVIRAEVFQ